MTGLELGLSLAVAILGGAHVWTYTNSFQRCLAMYTKGNADGYRRGCLATIDQYKAKKIKKAKKAKKTKSRKR